jgi:REP element-mobilizing transposase RayT
MAHPPRIPVWLPLDQPVIYFVTWCVQHRRPVLANAATLTAFQNAVGRLTRWQIIAGILMPDHVHTLACPLDRDEPVGEFSALVKRWMRQELASGHSASGPLALQGIAPAPPGIAGQAAPPAVVGQTASRRLALQWQWQPGCFDRLLRSDESAQQKWEYMRENPVRAALVSVWQDWPYRIGFNPPSGL